MLPIVESRHVAKEHWGSRWQVMNSNVWNLTQHDISHWNSFVVLSRWSDRFSILGCLVDGEPSHRWPSAKRLKCSRSHNNVARKMSRFGKPDVRESRNWNKAFQKRAEHSHASETPDGHRTFVGGSSRQGPPSTGPVKPSGGAQPLRTV